MFRWAPIGIICTASALAVCANADDRVGLSDGGGFVHVGWGAARQADQGGLSVSGIPVPGSGYRTDPQLGLMIEVGLFLRGGFALAVSGTLPMRTPDYAAGSLSGLGLLGSETNGYYTATAQYHFPALGPLRPYVGAGLGYMHVFGTTDGAVTDLRVASAAGPALQVGAELDLRGPVSIYVDIKRLFITSSATGTFLGMSASAKPKVDPWIVSSGVSVGF